MLVLRRQDVGAPLPDTALAFAPRRRHADIQQHAGRGVPAHVEPMIDVLVVVIEKRVPDRGSERIGAPAIRVNGGAGLKYLVPAALNSLAAQASRMQEPDMG